ncbi:hypothetical protein DEO72_LG3g1828 [Vigna unguiculata]|uniref:Uncharacterized protein n=1 Tax=Vigna unguiculata TaxID=3917 RepID=A0A4D6LGK7_VIGUN|nr:hypothetical protein DEO72_LG3g1828 [Vigna unguiculata]
MHCCIEVSGFFQKPPGGSSPTARRHIKLLCCSCFGMNRLAVMSFCPAVRHFRVRFDGFTAVLHGWMRIENVAIGEVTIIGKEEKRVGIVEYAEKWVPGGLTKPPGDRLSVREYYTEGRLTARCAPPGGDEKTMGLGECWRLAVHGWCLTCDDMNGEVHIQLLSRGDTSESRTTSGEVRRAGLRAGSSPFLFVFGDDRVIRYTGADVDTGGAEDVQMAE